MQCQSERASVPCFDEFAFLRHEDNVKGRWLESLIILLLPVVTKSVALLVYCYCKDFIHEVNLVREGEGEECMVLLRFLYRDLADEGWILFPLYG